MSFKQALSKIPLIRIFVIKMLKIFNRDISITNAYSGHKLRLNSYHHKSYWYFGREREIETMHLFSQYIHEGDTVIEIGGHIGFITQYFSKLVGSNGKVVVFEPGSNNIPYIEANIHSLQNVVLVRAAVSSKNGVAIFYEDNITGQNNSLLSDYENAELVAKSHGENLIRTAREVELVTIDSYVAEHSLSPDFLKIDIEGCELDALLGAQATLQCIRSLMVEVTKQHEAIGTLLRNAGFKMFNEHGVKIDTISFSGNVFAIR